MYPLHIMLNCNNTVICLTYKERKSAYDSAAQIDAVMGSRSEKIISLEDDFGHRASIEIMSVAATLVIDLEEELEIQVLSNLAKARAEKKFQRMASNDPSIKFVGGIQ